MFGLAVWLRVSAYRSDATLTTAAGGNGTIPAGAEGNQRVTRGADDGFIVTADGRQTDSSGAAVLDAREQRYRELLKAAPPPAPSASQRSANDAAQPSPGTTEQPNVLQRMVAPIASAFGLGEGTRTAATPARRQEEPSGDGGAAEDATRKGTASSEEDPDTDVVPPQLLAADFTPPQVRDGEETLLTVMVNDNLSGVRSVSGVIVSPSQALQGFACRREGESNLYVAKISIPKDAAEGVWTVRYLTLTDNASNTTTLLWAQGGLPPTASFRVTSSDSDASGPRLEAIWLDRPAMRGGERNTLFIQATDDKTGVWKVSGSFVSPGRLAHIGFGCNGGADDTDDTWECVVSPPTCLDCGVWHLEQVQLQDKANNTTRFGVNHALVAGVELGIAGDQCDGIAPVIVALSLSPDRVSNLEASAIKVRATISDEGGCGAASLSGQTVPPGGTGGQRNFIPFRPIGDGQTFEGTLEIPKHAAKGRWTIAWINALDKGFNMRSYQANDPVLSRVWFEVE